MDFTPGWYKDISNGEYRLSNGISSSDLKPYMDTAPARILYDILNPKDSKSDALNMGTVVHTAVLEPNQLDTTTAIMPDFNLHTKNGRALRDQYLIDNADKTIVTEQQFEHCLGMASAITASPQAQMLLDGSINESSIYWTHESGELLKCRPDAISQNMPVLLDIKTSENGSFDQFVRSILRFGYHISAGMYLQGVNSNPELLQELGVDQFQSMIHIVVEKEPPYLVSIYDLSDTLALGTALFNIALNRFIEAKRTEFPGYPAEIRVVELPPWAARIPVI